MILTSPTAQHTAPSPRYLQDLYCSSARRGCAARAAKVDRETTQYDHIRTCVLGVECEACHGFNEHNGYGLDRD